MALTSFLKRLSESIDSVIGKIVFLAITGMIISITLQIVFRVFFHALTWTEEMSRYLLVWSTFLGATMAYKRGMHISVTFCVNIFPEKIRKLIVILGIIFSLVFFAVAINYGIKLMVLQKVQISPALRLPMRWVYLVLPTSFIIMTIYGITAVLEELFNTGEVNV